MKKAIVFATAVLLSCLGGGILNAQDIITLKNGEDLKTRILEVLDGEIKYKRFDNLDGPVFTIRKSEILMITYQNGTRDVMSSVSSDNYYHSGYPQQTGRPYTMSPDALRPNMSYRELRHIYNTSLWDGHRIDDPYYAQWCWNILLTGLGQMTMGEVGRGCAFLGAQVGCYALSVAGAITAGVSDSYTGATIGFLFVIAGSAGSVVTWVCSMVDAAQMARIKSMYARDMRNFASSIDFKLSPWVAPVPTGANGNYMTAAGLSLSMTF